MTASFFPLLFGEKGVDSMDSLVALFFLSAFLGNGPQVEFTIRARWISGHNRGRVGQDLARCSRYLRTLQRVDLQRG